MAECKVHFGLWIYTYMCVERSLVDLRTSEREKRGENIETMENGNKERRTLIVFLIICEVERPQNSVFK